MTVLALLAEVERCRLACAQVRRDTGGLLPDDPCVVELLHAERALECFDRDRGWSRSKTADFAKPVPAGGTTGQRNPNWRAALNKLNAMRGRPPIPEGA